MDEYKKIASLIEKKQAKYLNDLQKLVRQPSVSVEQHGTKESAELIAEWMTQLRFTDVRVYPGDGNPIVYGFYESEIDREKTLLLFGAYDSNPVEEEKWTIPPYEGRIITHPEKGRLLVGRGVNNKIKIAGILNAIESVKAAVGSINCNLITVFDGEEEMFSPTLPRFIKEYRPLLEKANSLYMPFPSQNSQGIAKVQLGYKGVLYLELKASGKSWQKGPSEHEIHSMHRPVVDNPVWRLIMALKSMVSDDSNKVLVEGFMEDIVGPDDEFRGLLEELALDFSVDSYKSSLGVRNLINEEDNALDLLKQLFFTCRINIDGIWAGYTGTGPEAVIPEEATAKIDIRLVPNQKTETIQDRIIHHLDNHNFSDITVSKLASVESCRTRANQEIVKALIRAYNISNTRFQVWPTSLATIPISLFNNDPLKLPFATGCVGAGGESHGSDEYLLIDGTDKVDGIGGFVKLISYVIWEYGQNEG